MEIWFEGDILYYDLEHNRVRPQFIQTEGYNITGAALIGNDVHVTSDKGGYIIFDIDNPKITRVTMRISDWQCTVYPDWTGYIEHDKNGYAAVLYEGWGTYKTLEEAEAYLINNDYEKV